MKVFITGITGTLGTAIAQYHHSKGDEVVGCGRSESKLAEWMRQYSTVGQAYLGDCLSLGDKYSDLYRLARNCHKVYHCAALKHVDLCERQPVEAYRQNIGNVEIVSEMCQRLGVPFVFISSDKACLPQGVYGATKLIGEQIVLRRGGAVVRFGNLIGSSGSVFQKWAEAVKRGEPIQLTDPEMTRYFIAVEEAAKFTVEGSVNGFVRIPIMKAVQMGELAEYLTPHVKAIGRRPGETQHQWLIAPGEVALTDYHAQVISLGDAEGAYETEGLSSRDAQRWDYGDLLEIGGIQI